MVLSQADEKTWASALNAARQALARTTPAARTAPDYETKTSISQPQHRLKSIQVESLVADYRGGLSTYQLATKWKVDRHTVTSILDRNGVKQRSYAVKLTEAELAEAAALRADGWSLNALAKRYGISPNTMKKRLMTPGDGCSQTALSTSSPSTTGLFEKGQ